LHPSHLHHVHFLLCSCLYVIHEYERSEEEPSARSPRRVVEGCNWRHQKVEMS
jgi:hypothetical protein